jgi:hypothetical protein
MGSTMREMGDPSNTYGKPHRASEERKYFWPRGNTSGVA